MTETGVRFSRRQLLTEVGAGFAGGAVIGAGFVFADVWHPHLTISIVGSNAAQVALVRTPSTRVAVVLGPWRSDLMQALLPLLGWTQRRIDLLVLAASPATTEAVGWVKDRGLARQHLFVATAATPATQPHPDVINGISATQLEDDVRLEIHPAIPATRGVGSPRSSPWAAVVHWRAGMAWLVETLSGLEWLGLAGRPSLVIVPEGAVQPLIHTFRPQAVACNTGASFDEFSADGPEGDFVVAVARTFPRDPTSFQLLDTGLQMPPGTILFTGKPS